VGGYNGKDPVLHSALTSFENKADIIKQIAPNAPANLIGYAIGGVLLIAAGALTNFALGSTILFVLFLTHA
jgi:poly(3-hydroxyalkanoate) synthetase